MNIATEAPLLLDIAENEETAAVLAVAELLKGHPLVKDHAALAKAVCDRQAIQAPLLGNGIALPHARTDSVAGIIFAIGRCRQPIPFGADHTPVSLIFLYGTPPSMVAPSLAAVAGLVEKLHWPEILAGLLEAPDEATFRRILA